MYEIKSKKPNSGFSNVETSSPPASVFKRDSSVKLPGSTQASGPTSAWKIAPPTLPGIVQRSPLLQEARRPLANLPEGPGIQRTAQAGVQGQGRPLPYLNKLQSAFGQHDLSGIQTYTGPKAQTASEALGAKAYATGNKIAFSEQNPDLHTVAHETTHVLQQQAGVQLKSQVGEVGDRYEQQADAVANRVLHNQRVDGLLGTPAKSSMSNSSGSVTSKMGTMGNSMPVQMMRFKATGEKAENNDRCKWDTANSFPQDLSKTEIFKNMRVALLTKNSPLDLNEQLWLKEVQKIVSPNKNRPLPLLPNKKENQPSNQNTSRPLPLIPTKATNQLNVGQTKKPAPPTTTPRPSSTVPDSDKIGEMIAKLKDGPIFIGESHDLDRASNAIEKLIEVGAVQNLVLEIRPVSFNPNVTKVEKTNLKDVLTYFNPEAKFFEGTVPKRYGNLINLAVANNKSVYFGDINEFSSGGNLKGIKKRNKHTADFITKNSLNVAGTVVLGGVHHYQRFSGIVDNKEVFTEVDANLSEDIINKWIETAGPNTPIPIHLLLKHHKQGRFFDLSTKN